MNKWQMTGFVLANVCGLFICFVAVQFYSDIIPLYSGEDKIVRPDQIVVNKHVSLGKALNGNAPVFTERELTELRSQPFVDSVACFESAAFPVIATIGNPAMGMMYSTEMFLEAVPDGFIDVDLSDWKYEEGDKEVPIIIPKNYLNLYNFGFARSRGLPNITEGMIRQVGVALRLGDGAMMRLSGHVVGFSRSINTVLVPQKFLRYANARLSSTAENAPSRVIIRVNNPADERIDRYLTDNNLETEGDGADVAKTARMLKLVLLAVLFVGVVICTLSFFILLTSIYLLLQRNRYKIDSLMMIGYAPGALARPFVLFALAVNVLSAAVALVLVTLSRGYYLEEFGQLAESYSVPSLYPSALAAVSLCLLMSILNTIAINRNITNKQ